MRVLVVKMLSFNLLQKKQVNGIALRWFADDAAVSKEIALNETHLPNTEMVLHAYTEAQMCLFSFVVIIFFMKLFFCPSLLYENLNLLPLYLCFIIRSVLIYLFLLWYRSLHVFIFVVVVSVVLLFTVTVGKLLIKRVFN